MTNNTKHCQQCNIDQEILYSFPIDDYTLTTLSCRHILKETIVSPKTKSRYDELISNDDMKPYPFQITGMEFIENALKTHKGALIADEMGLGKTVQSLGYLKYHPESLPVLFIVKSGIKYQWSKEIYRWTGQFNQVISTTRDFLFPGMPCYIISYDLLVGRHREGKEKIDIIDKILKLGIKTIVLDEVHQIRNSKSARTGKTKEIVSKVDKVIALSGTPWKNRGGEFYTVLHMIDPRRFPSEQKFLDEHVEYYWDGNRPKQGGIRNPRAFKEYVSDIVLRRERIEVLPELPLINRTIHYTEIDAESQKQYDNETSDFVRWYNEQLASGDEGTFETQSNIMARLARMRHITGLAKIPSTVELVEDFIEDTDRKLVIFVHHKDVGSILATEISKLSLPVWQLTSELDSSARFDLQERFNQTKRAILVASTIAAGEGLNLQTCSDCILHERQWNPANEEQAEGRFIRIGQTANQVNATYVTAAGTVDEHLANLVEKKRRSFHDAMNNSEMRGWNESGMIGDLAASIVQDYQNKKPNKLKLMAGGRV